MLSRAASNIFWLARYIERAENIASLLSANFKFLLDSENIDASETSKTWTPIMRTLDILDSYEKCIETDTDITPLCFLTSDLKNFDSLYNCICQARENARMVRDQISEKMWLEINSIYLYFKGVVETTSWRRAPEDLFNRVIRFSFLFQGITDATITYGEGHGFYQLGKYMERADKTSRILDLPHYSGNIHGQNEWSEVLNASGGRGAYIAQYGVVSKEDNVTNFLIFSEDFPRSLRFCLYKINRTLNSISRSKVRKRYSDEAERIAGAALAKVDFEGHELLDELGLHEYIDGFQGDLNSIGQQIFEIYFLIKFESDLTHIEPIVVEGPTANQVQNQS